MTGGVKTLQQIEEVISTGPLMDYETYGFGRFAIELKKDSKFIGFTGLKFMEDLGSCRFRLSIGKGTLGGKVWRTESGVASLRFGFEELDFDEIVATILPENLASANVLSKLGFTLEEELTMYGVPQQLFFSSACGMANKTTPNTCLKLTPALSAAHLTVIRWNL